MIKTNFSQFKKRFVQLAWDLWCIVSIAGIWPRFIEPKLISTTKITLPIPNLPESLNAFKIVQLSDIHFNTHLSRRFLNKLKRKVEKLKPDIIVFTGDFICNSRLSHPEELVSLLQSFSAPYGCYAVLGNHDYEKYVSITPEWDYGIIRSSESALKKGWKLIFSNPKLSKKITEEARQVALHTDLLNVLKKTPFKILHNQSIAIPIKESFLNICGLGEYTLGKCLPEQAFQNYDKRFPGIILSHNPDSLPLLKQYPGEVVLSGHSHGGQVNLPFLREKFAMLENSKLMRGLHRAEDKWIYVNRGIGGSLPFRWFSPPEILLLTLAQDAAI